MDENFLTIWSCDVRFLFQMLGCVDFVIWRRTGVKNSLDLFSVSQSDLEPVTRMPQ